MRTRPVFILGSGPSLHNLSRDERDFLNQHGRTVAPNRYLLHYEDIGIIPECLFAADRQFPAQDYFLQLLRKAASLPQKPRMYVNEYYTRLCARSLGSMLDRFRMRYGLWRKEGYWFPWSGPWKEIELIAFRSGLASDRPFFWAESLDEELYFYRSSLTTTLNLVSIVYPGADICLLGVDLNQPGHFFSDERKANERTTQTDFEKRWSNLEKETGLHATAASYRGVPGIQSVIPKIVERLADDGRRLVCGNPSSLLVEEGICEYRSVLSFTESAVLN